MSVALSESLLLLPMIMFSASLAPETLPLGIGMTTDRLEVSCSLSIMTVFLGDCGSPSRSHSRSNSSSFFEHLDFDLGSGIIFGLLKQRKIRRGIFAADPITDELLLPAVALGGSVCTVFNRLYANDVSSAKAKTCH